MLHSQPRLSTPPPRAQRDAPVTSVRRETDIKCPVLGCPESSTTVTALIIHLNGEHKISVKGISSDELQRIGCKTKCTKFTRLGLCPSCDDNDNTDTHMTHGCFEELPTAEEICQAEWAK